jgi:pyruvate-ferredoxin/flavodoxin oxidoreductase
MEQQKLAVESAYWPLYRYDPRRKAQGKNPFQLDSKAPKIALKDYAYNETRYKMLTQSMPERAEMLLAEAQKVVIDRWNRYQQMAAEEVLEPVIED